MKSFFGCSLKVSAATAQLYPSISSLVSPIFVDSLSFDEFLYCNYEAWTLFTMKNCVLLYSCSGFRVCSLKKIIVRFYLHVGNSTINSSSIFGRERISYFAYIDPRFDYNEDIISISLIILYVQLSWVMTWQWNKTVSNDVPHVILTWAIISIIEKIQRRGRAFN